MLVTQAKSWASYFHIVVVRTGSTQAKRFEESKLVVVFSPEIDGWFQCCHWHRWLCSTLDVMLFSFHACLVTFCLTEPEIRILYWRWQWVGWIRKVLRAKSLPTLLCGQTRFSTQNSLWIDRNIVSFCFLEVPTLISQDSVDAIAGCWLVYGRVIGEHFKVSECKYRVPYLVYFERRIRIN